MGRAFWRVQVALVSPSSSRATTSMVRRRLSSEGPVWGPAEAEKTQLRKALSPITPLLRVTGAKEVKTGT